MKKITLFIVLISIISLSSTVWPFFSLYGSASIARLDFLQVFHLDVSIGGGTSAYFIWLNIMLNFLMICSAIVYYFSNGKETRFLRFLLGIVLFSKFILVLSSILFLIFGDLDVGSYGIIQRFLYYIIQIAFIYGAYKLLVYLNTRRELEIVYDGDPEIVPASYVFASDWERFMHLIFDFLITYMSIAPMINFMIHQYTVKNSLNTLESIIGPRPSLMLIAGVFRFMYYFLFEFLLSSSPAKFLTETRVVSDNGVVLKPGNIVARTLYRFVPFDALSFVLGRTGWHDRWSKTSVVKEKRTGIKGAWYFLIPLGLILLMTLGYLVELYNRSYTSMRYNQSISDKQMEEKHKKLDQLSTNDIIELYSSDNYNLMVYLKPEKIKDDRVECSVITLNNSYEYSPDHETIEDFYKRYKDVWQIVELDKHNLASAIGEFDRASDDRYKTDLEDDEGVIIQGVQGKYIIKTIESYFEPNIKLVNFSNRSPKHLIFALKNIAWNASITDIQTVKGGVSWNKNQLPLVIRKSNYETIIQGESTEAIEEFEFDVTVLDSLGRKQLYKVTGNAAYGNTDETKMIRQK